MMNDRVDFRISPELKKDAEEVFGAMGMKTSAAIRLFLQHSVNMGGLPFRPAGDVLLDGRSVAKVKPHKLRR